MANACCPVAGFYDTLYRRLDVHLTERGESFYNSMLPAVVSDLDMAGLLVDSDSAKCIFVPGFIDRNGKPLPLIIQKSDGGFNYATTDLAAIRYRVNTDLAKEIIYVTDAGQSQHSAMVFGAARLAGWVPPAVQLVHVPFGLVQGEDGKRFRTRSGEVVRLEDLLDEACRRTRVQADDRAAEEGRS